MAVALGPLGAFPEAPVLLHRVLHRASPVLWGSTRTALVSKASKVDSSSSALSAPHPALTSPRGRDIEGDKPQTALLALELQGLLGMTSLTGLVFSSFFWDHLGPL